MKRILLVLVGLTFVVSVGARAEETVKETVKERVKPYTPRAGLWEFELDGPAFPVGQINFYGASPIPTGTLGIVTQPQRGANVSTTSTSTPGAGNLTTTSFGLTGSIGYCATDLLEVGLGLGFNTSSPPSELMIIGSATAFNAQPFLKFNLGASIDPDARVNPFLLAGAGINFVTSSSGSSSASTNNTFVIPELAVGVEVMVTRWWGISFYVPFTMAFNVTSGAEGDVKVIGVGFGYGVAAYFD